MDIKLTRDAEKVVAVLYKSYLERRKSGESKSDAKFCYPDEIRSRYLPKENPDDFAETLNEVFRVFPCKRFVDGGLVIDDSLIVYMENRFKNGLMDVASFLAQFIP